MYINENWILWGCSSTSNVDGGRTYFFLTKFGFQLEMLPAGFKHWGKEDGNKMF